MREIKFRDYDYENKSLWYFDLDSYDRYEHDAYGNIMQYTGLKDRNGVEIYEGDILRVSAKSDWDKVNYSCYEVFFHDGDANMDYNIGFSIARMHNHGSVCGGYIPSFKPKTVSHMEIIGNIYETPELLNQ